MESMEIILEHIVKGVSLALEFTAVLCICSGLC